MDEESAASGAATSSPHAQCTCRTGSNTLQGADAKPERNFGKRHHRGRSDVDDGRCSERSIGAQADEARAAHTLLQRVSAQSCKAGPDGAAHVGRSSPAEHAATRSPTLPQGRANGDGQTARASALYAPGRKGRSPAEMPTPQPSETLEVSIRSLLPASRSLESSTQVCFSLKALIWQQMSCNNLAWVAAACMLALCNIRALVQEQRSQSWQ